MTDRPTPPLRPLRTIRLQLWLPLLLLVVSLASMAVLAALQQREHHQALQQFAHQTAHEQLLATRRALETTLRRSDGSGLDAALAPLGLDPSVAHAVFSDDQGMVRAATRFAWRGQAVSSLAQYPGADTTARLAQGSATLLLSADGLQLTALAPVTLHPQASQMRTDKPGMLWLQYDLRPLAQQAQHRLQEQALWLAGVLLLAALLLLGLLHWAVLRPVAALRSAMARIGSGDFEQLPQWRGAGEFADLGHALARMAHRLQDSARSLAEKEQRYRQLSDSAFEAIVLHSNGVIVDANQAADELMAVPPGGLVGLPMLQFVAEHDHPITRLRTGSGAEGLWEVDLRDANGQIIPVECSVRQRHEGAQAVRAVAVRDIRARLAAEAEIRQLAHYDALTGLPNRRFILDQVQQELAEVERHPRRAALAAFNLNAFQGINDSLGMAAGDAVLRTMARRLSALLGPGQTLARVDGDTFALLLTDLGGDLQAASTQAARSIEQLLLAVAEPLEQQGQVLHLSAGAGVVMIPNDSRDPPELLREAETAMHQAKATGDARVRFFAHALQEAASERLALRNDLRLALGSAPAAAQQLLLHYQPQVGADGSLLGVEALVRWQHPRRGLVAPGQFIPEAEASGLIVPLGQWVLEEAVACLQRWQAAGHPWAAQLTMAVNVSPRQFREPDFIARVEDLLAHVDVRALSLELELTESVVADDLEATLEKMQALRRHGLRFALDDFGTGYSSLAYLKRLPIDTLKIDRSFVMDIDAPAKAQGGKRPAVLIDAIVAMAHQLDLRVLAEGVETPTQLAKLVQSGCDIFQGYHFSRPLPEAALAAWATASTPDRAAPPNGAPASACPPVGA
ncbi:bifunctional diguanylate cyclase/phosphodiesterase [Acidovorax sp. HDW3]|uniref:putative bifunctional diguanylate cyclase/phosphodiesterase n=1 Tax=Acidovorax sp. HDW3 TaxID=2714923 RepID=UPI001F0D0D7B|nr:EAL domain-containing protein [Acidovorax sp. HDW3]